MVVREILEQFGKTVDDINEIYYGNDHECRCGCQGKYYEKGSRSFKAALTRMRNYIPRKAGERHPIRGGETVTDNGIRFEGNYLNIPLYNTMDKCFTLYFN